MKIIYLAFLMALAAAPAHAARSRMVYSCGCNDHFPGDPGFTVRENWLLQHGWDLPAVQEASTAACTAKFGAGRFFTNCTQAPITGKELANTEAKQRARLARERAAYRAAEAQARRDWAYNEKLRREGIRRNNAVIDELKRRQRNDEIDRVLRRARDRGIR